jgi:hypothetical protein
MGNYQDVRTEQSFEGLCMCSPSLEKVLLWEEEIIPEQPKKCVGWITLLHCFDPVHVDGRGVSKLMVRYTNTTIPHDCRSHRKWIHDITDTPLGRFVIAGWIALNPDQASSLPKTHDEWLAMERRLLTESMMADLEDDGVKIDGMSEKELGDHWNELHCKERREELAADGWAPEEVQKNMNVGYRESM